MPAQVRDQARIDRPTHLSGVELITTSYAPRAFPRHTHPEWVLGAMVEGAERLIFDDGEFRVEAGDCLFVPAERSHANEAAGDARFGYRVFYVSQERLDGALAGFGSATDLAVFDRRRVREPGLNRLMRDIHRRLGGPVDLLEQETAFAALIGAVAQYGMDRSAPTPEPSRGVGQAKRHIETHFSEGFSLEDLAGLAGLSPFHFLRMFKRELGLTPAAYRNQKRVTEACRRLRQGRPIAEVAADVGFSDQSHMTRAFQKIMGVTPAAFAQQ